MRKHLYWVKKWMQFVLQAFSISLKIKELFRCSFCRQNARLINSLHYRNRAIGYWQICSNYKWVGQFKSGGTSTIYYLSTPGRSRSYLLQFKSKTRLQSRQTKNIKSHTGYIILLLYRHRFLRLIPVDRITFCLVVLPVQVHPVYIQERDTRKGRQRIKNSSLHYLEACNVVNQSIA